MNKSIRTWVTTIILALSALSVASCGGAPNEAADSREATGTLKGALQTTAPDGGTYSFPPGTLLRIAGPVALEWQPIDGPETVFSLDLPPGVYELEFDFPGNPQLRRTKDGESQLVAAQWTEPQPFKVTIEEDETTTATFHFLVKGLGVVTFSIGTLDVTLDVTSSTSISMSAAAEGEVDLYSQTYNDSTAAYAAALGVDVNTIHSLALSVVSTGDWIQSGSSGVCKTVAAQQVTGSADLGWSRRLAQLSGATGHLCVRNRGAADWVIIQLRRYNSAAPADQLGYLPNSYQFEIYVGGAVGDVFDGSTLNEAALATATPLTDGVFDQNVQQLPAYTMITRIMGDFDGTVMLAP
jgi:hypothetical protein